MNTEDSTLRAPELKLHIAQGRESSVMLKPSYSSSCVICVVVFFKTNFY